MVRLRYFLAYTIWPVQFFQDSSLLAQEIKSPLTPDDASSSVKVIVDDIIKLVAEVCASTHNTIRSYQSGSSNANKSNP